MQARFPLLALHLLSAAVVAVTPALTAGRSADCDDTACATRALLFASNRPSLTHPCSGVRGIAFITMGGSFTYIIQLNSSVAGISADTQVRIFNSSSVCASEDGSGFCGVSRHGEKGRLCPRVGNRNSPDTLAFSCSGLEDGELAESDGVILAVFQRASVAPQCSDTADHVAVLLFGELDFSTDGEATGSSTSTAPEDNNLTNTVGNENTTAGEGGSNGDTASVGSGEDTLGCVRRPDPSCTNEEKIEYVILKFDTGDFDGDTIDLAVSLIRDPEITPLYDKLNVLNSISAAIQDNPPKARIHLNSTRVENIILAIGELLSDESEREWAQLDKVVVQASQLLQSTESFLEFLAKQVQADMLPPVHVFTPTIGVLVVSGAELTDTASNGTVTAHIYNPHRTDQDSGFGQEMIKVNIASGLLCQSTSDNCTSVMTASVLQNLPNYLTTTAANESRPASEYLLSLQVLGAPQLPTRIISQPVAMEFNTANSIAIYNLSRGSHRCVFWDFDQREWSSAGVTTEVTMESKTVCSTSHLTGFTVLLDVSNVTIPRHEKFALQIVSYIGCAISIVCLALTVMALIVFQKLLSKGVLFYVHLNLALAMLLAYTVFCAGLETAVSIEILCTVVAAVLHYLFLCVFCWMLAEGIMLYLLVVRVFGTAADKWYYLLFLGWGLPVLVVAVSVGIRYRDYGNEDFCWISVNGNHGTIWAFAAPVIAVILVNTVFLVLAVVNIIRSKKYSATSTRVKQAKLAIKSTVILLPLLGVTWAFGLLAVNENTTVFAWLFTIFNSLQGFFFFLFHIVRNEKVLSSIKNHIFCCSSQPSKGLNESTFTISGAPNPEKPIVPF